MDDFMNEISAFVDNAYNFRQPTLLIIIAVSIFVIAYCFIPLCEYAAESFGNTLFIIRAAWFYVCLMGYLIVTYNGFCSPVQHPQWVRIQVEPANHAVDINLFGLGLGFGGAQPDDVRGPDDTQNVHDSSIQAHIIETVNKLKEKVKKPSISSADTLSQIKNYILTEYKGNNNTKENALYSIKKINRYRGIIGNLNMNEIDVLQLVWNRITDPVNKEHSKTLKENLVLQLADIVYNEEELYCVQGRVTRIIQSLEHADAEDIVTLKPLWVVKDEIASFFSKYRTNYISQLSKKGQYLCNECINPTQKEQQFVAKVNKSISSGIRKRLTIRYVDSKLITMKQFQTITDPFFAEFA